jgi:glucokinase
VLDGRLYRGARFGAGELGHGPLVAGGRHCACGLRGCLEAYTGGAAIAARIREDVADGVSTAIAELAGGDPARISARHWIEALRAGDAYARQLREEYIERLAQALALLVVGLDVDCIALGTIVARNPDLFLDELRVRFAEQVWPRLRATRIGAGELGERLPAYAGLCTALLEPFEPSEAGS